MPGSASKPSTSRKLRGNRKYSQPRCWIPNGLTHIHCIGSNYASGKPDLLVLEAPEVLISRIERPQQRSAARQLRFQKHCPNGFVLEPIWRPAVVIVQKGFVVARQFSGFIVGWAMPDSIRRHMGLHRVIGPINGVDDVWSK